MYHIRPWSKAFSRSEKAKCNDLFSLCFSMNVQTTKMVWVVFKLHWLILISIVSWRCWLRIKTVYRVWQEVGWSVAGTICQVTFVLKKGNNDTCRPGSRHMARLHNGTEEICQPIGCCVTKYKGHTYNSCRIWLSWSNGGSPQYPPIRSVFGGMLLCCSALGNEMFGFIS